MRTKWKEWLVQWGLGDLGYVLGGACSNCRASMLQLPGTWERYHVSTESPIWLQKARKQAEREFTRDQSTKLTGLLNTLHVQVQVQYALSVHLCIKKYGYSKLALGFKQTDVSQSYLTECNTL